MLKNNSSYSYSTNYIETDSYIDGFIKFQTGVRFPPSPLILFFPKSLQRKFATAFIAIYDEASTDLVGYLLDMTTQGLKLKSTKPLNIDTVYESKMELPVEIENSNIISFSAESKWSNKCENSMYHETGFEILNVQPEDLDKMKILLDGPLFSDVGKKIHISLSMMDP